MRTFLKNTNDVGTIALSVFTRAKQNAIVPNKKSQDLRKSWLIWNAKESNPTV